MLYCRDCGQCSHISDETFLSYENTEGWESSRVDCINGEYIEHYDAEITESDFDYYECMHCYSQNVESDSYTTAEEAVRQRGIYDKRGEKAEIAVDWDL